MLTLRHLNGVDGPSFVAGMNWAYAQSALFRARCSEGEVRRVCVKSAREHLHESIRQRKSAREAAV